MSTSGTEAKTAELSVTDTDAIGDQLSVEEWLQLRKEAGLAIDPETAEVTWTYAETGDPYGVEPDLPEEYCIGREYFARAPGSDIWVHFHDLPKETRERLWEMHGPELAFPAGLFDVVRQH